MKSYGDSNYLVRCCPYEEKYWIESGEGVGRRQTLICLKTLFYSKPYFHLLSLSVLPSCLINQEEQPRWLLRNSVCIWGNSIKGENCQRLRYLALSRCRFMVLQTPGHPHHGLTWCCLCSMMQKKEEAVCFLCRTLPSLYHSSVQLWQRSRPSSLFRHHPQTDAADWETSFSIAQ